MKISNVFNLTAILFVLLTPLMAQENKTIWTLEDCINYAHQNNLQIRQEALNHQTDKAYLSQAKAARLPDLNASASGSNIWGTSFDIASGQLVDDNSYQTASFGLNSNVTVFNGFKLNNSIKQNDLEAKAGFLDVETLKNDISLNVANAYLQILFLEEQIEVAQNQIDYTKQQIEMAQAKFEEGQIAQNDVLQLQAQLAEEDYNLVNLENQARLAQINLMQLIELPVTEDFQIAIPDQLVLSPLVQNFEEIYHKSLAIRPEIQSALLKASSSDLGVSIAKADYMPKLTMGGSLSSRYSSTSILYDFEDQIVEREIGYLQSNPNESVIGTSVVSSALPINYSFSQQLQDNFSPSVSLTLSVPIFNKKSTQTQVQIARINQEKSQLQIRSTENQLRKDLEQSYADYWNAQKEYLAAQKQEEASNLTYQNAVYQYEEGLLNTTDLLLEKNKLATAESNVLQAKYNNYFNRKILDFYQGVPFTL